MKKVKRIPEGGSVPSRQRNANAACAATETAARAGNLSKPVSALPDGSGGSCAEATRGFEGLPYEDIVGGLLERWGIYGEPAEGGRNTTLYRLAREMRYVCDFSVALLMEALPEWGLGAQEKQQTISSACNSPRGTKMPRDLAAVIDRLRREREGGKEEQEADGTPRRMNPLPAKLPPLLSYFVRRNPLNERAALLACLPVLGNTLCRLRARYLDGTLESPIFMCVIVGPQASGKSFLRDIYETLGAPMLEADREMQQKEHEYQDRCRKAKNAKTQPELETFPRRCIPATVSNTQLLRRADQNDGLSLLSFAPEIDTLKRSASAGAWAQKGDIYRIGFEAGQYGQDYASETSYSAVVELRYNLLLSGTDAAVRAFFKNVENGMVSRFCFAQMADDRGKKVRPKPSAVGSLTREKVIGRMRELYELGSNPSPEATVTFELPRTLAALDQWTDERIAEYMQTGDAAIDILRRRSCLIGFRAGMVAWALSGCKETREVRDFALWVASETLNQQLALYGKALNEQEQENQRIREQGQQQLRRSRNMRLLDELPDAFTKSDLAALRTRHGLEGECSYILSRWVANGIVMRRPDGLYEKLKKSVKPIN